MYKNHFDGLGVDEEGNVSILVLMDLCIKTHFDGLGVDEEGNVSILVLMDLCIKTSSKNN